MYYRPIYNYLTICKILVKFHFYTDDVVILGQYCDHSVPLGDLTHLHHQPG